MQEKVVFGLRMRGVLLLIVLVCALLGVGEGRRGTVSPSRKGRPYDRTVCTLPAVDYGVIYTFNGPGDIITYRCENGFMTFGHTFAKCNRGQWSNSPPICVAGGCSLSYYLEHGRVAVGYGGAVARYECDSGYTLSGDDFLVCNGRTWNGTVPECASRTRQNQQPPRERNSREKAHEDWLTEADYSCIKRKDSISPPKVPDAHTTTRWAVIEGKPRLYALYRCKLGFIASGRAKNMYCQNGAWVGSQPKCREAVVKRSRNTQMPRDEWDRSRMSHEDWLDLADYSCVGTVQDPHRVPPPTVHNAIYRFQYRGVSGAPRLFAEFTCSSDYQLRNDKKYMYCRNKSWMGETPHCVKGDERERAAASPAAARRVVDECSYNNGGCSQICERAHTGKRCRCYRGFRLEQDGKTCKRYVVPRRHSSRNQYYQYRRQY